MAISSDSIGLLFRAKGDTDDAKNAFSHLRSSVTGDINAIDDAGKTGFTSLAKSFGFSESAATSLAGALPMIGAAIAGITAVLTVQIAVAVRAVTGLYDLAKSASEAGSELFDAQEKTGLSAEMLSTLKLAADNAGSSLEQVTSSTSKFARLLGEAQAGNEKARATLMQLGVTSYDLDTALNQVAGTITNAKEGTDQLVLAQKAFGKSGADLLPVLKQLGGDLENAKKEAERLGTTLSDSDIKAADEFGDTLGVLSSQVETAANRFALQFAPEITKALAAVSKFLADNQQIAREWGSVVAGTVRGIGLVFSTVSNGVTAALNAIGIKFTSSASQARAWAEGILFAINPVLSLMYRIDKIFGGGTKAQGEEGSGQANEIPEFSIQTKGGGGKGKDGGESAADKAAKAAKEAFQARVAELRRELEFYEAMADRIVAKAERDAQKGLLTDQEVNQKKRVAAEQTAFYKLSQLEKELAAAQEYGQETVDIEHRIKIEREKISELGYKNEAVRLREANELRQKHEKEYLEFSKKTIAEREKLERAGVEAFRKAEKAKFDLAIKNGENILQNTIDAHTFLRESYENDYQSRLVTAQAERDRRLAEIEELVIDETKKREAIAEVNALYDAEALAAKQELAAQMDAIDEEYAIPSVSEEDRKYGPFQDLIDGFTQFVELVKSQGPSLGQTLQGMAGMFINAFRGMAQAMGSVVQQWVLMGSTGPAMMRKILASALASIAAEAAVRAIWELGLGFASLFLNPAEAAAHFTAAAIFGGIAGVAAISGRAIAGNAFKNESSGGYGTAPSSSSTTPSGQGQSAGAGVYSSNEDQVVEVGRNSPSAVMPKMQLQLGIKLDSKGVLEIVKESIRSNGDLRNVILEAI